MKNNIFFFALVLETAAFAAPLSTTPSPVDCVRVNPAGIKRLWQGISPTVKEWEQGKRTETLEWFEENQFGRTPIGRLKDQKIEESAVVFEDSGIRINITCRLPEGASADKPVPVFLFGDHRGGNKPPYAQEEYPNIPTNAITARGYAYVRWNFNDVCPNVSNWGGMSRWPMGIIAWQAVGDKTATNIVRKANSWGTIGAWAWGNSRVMDWIETRPELDAKRVAVVGHSRGGKTALWTAAQDERFAMAVSNGSGCGGASLGRARGAKAVSIKAMLKYFPNWFCPAMANLIGRDAELEHDADDLLRLIAPRLVYVGSGSEDIRAGPESEKAAVDSARGLYRAYKLEERVGYHCHKGPHKLLPVDWEKFMDFADRHMKKPSSQDSDEIERMMNSALEKGGRVLTIGKNPFSRDGVWRLVRAITVPDDFTVIFDGCRVELADLVQDNIIRNAGAAEGNCRPNRNIRILGRNGAVLSGGRRNHYLPRRSGDPNGWRSVGILLCDVSDYEVAGFKMDETQCWAISQERCSNGYLHDIVFNSSDAMFNQDGIDLRKGCHDILIENISGRTGDDTVALTALRDAPGAKATKCGMQIGGNEYRGEKDDIYNVTIRNIRSRSSGGHSIIRLLCCDGIKMHHIKIDGVEEIAAGNEKRSKSVIRIGDAHYSRTRAPRMGEMHNIEVKNVKTSGGNAVVINAPLCDSSFTALDLPKNVRRVKINAPLKRVKFDSPQSDKSVLDASSVRKRYMFNDVKVPVKVFYDAAYPIEKGSDCRVAVILIHGWGGHVRTLLPIFNSALAERAAGLETTPYLIAPMFPRRESLAKNPDESDDGRAVWNDSWVNKANEEPGSALDDWRGGGDANGTTFSSYDYIDRILDKLCDRALYPRLERIVLAGFSAGGQFAGRYAAIGKGNVREGVKLVYIDMSPSTDFLFEKDDPWLYGLKGRPRYADGLADADIMKNLCSRRVWRGCGSEDTLGRPYTALDMTPCAVKQGSNRLERFKNFEEYLDKYPEWKKQVSFYVFKGIGHKEDLAYPTKEVLDFIFER